MLSAASNETVIRVNWFRFSSILADIALCLSLLLSFSANAQQAAVVKRGVVEIETSGSAGISLRMVEDLANLIDDGKPS